MNKDLILSELLGDVNRTIRELPFPMMRAFWTCSEKNINIDVAGYDQFTFTEVEHTSAIHLFAGDLPIASLSVPEGVSKLDWKISIPSFLNRNSPFSFSFTYRGSRIQPRIFAQMWTVSSEQLEKLKQQVNGMRFAIEDTEVWLQKDQVKLIPGSNQEQRSYRYSAICLNESD